MKKTIRKRRDGFLGYSSLHYGFFDFKIDMMVDISWYCLNYLKEYKLDMSWPGIVTVPRYASYPFSKKNRALLFFENDKFFFDIIVIRERI